MRLLDAAPPGEGAGDPCFKARIKSSIERRVRKAATIVHRDQMTEANVHNTKTACQVAFERPNASWKSAVANTMRNVKKRETGATQRSLLAKQSAWSRRHSRSLSSVVMMNSCPRLE